MALILAQFKPDIFKINRVPTTPQDPSFIASVCAPIILLATDLAETGEFISSDDEPLSLPSPAAIGEFVQVASAAIKFGPQIIEYSQGDTNSSADTTADGTNGTNSTKELRNTRSRSGVDGAKGKGKKSETPRRSLEGTLLGIMALIAESAASTPEEEWLVKPGDVHGCRVINGIVRTGTVDVSPTSSMRRAQEISERYGEESSMRAGTKDSPMLGVSLRTGNEADTPSSFSSPTSSASIGLTIQHSPPLPTPSTPTETPSKSRPTTSSKLTTGGIAIVDEHCESLEFENDDSDDDDSPKTGDDESRKVSSGVESNYGPDGKNIVDNGLGYGRSVKFNPMGDTYGAGDSLMSSAAFFDGLASIGTGSLSVLYNQDGGRKEDIVVGEESEGSPKDERDVKLASWDEDKPVVKNNENGDRDEGSWILNKGEPLSPLVDVKPPNHISQSLRLPSRGLVQVTSVLSQTRHRSPRDVERGMDESALSRVFTQVVAPNGVRRAKTAGVVPPLAGQQQQQQELNQHQHRQEIERLERRVAELEKENSSLKLEMEEMRRQLRLKNQTPPLPTPKPSTFLTDLGGVALPASDRGDNRGDDINCVTCSRKGGMETTAVAEIIVKTAKQQDRSPKHSIQQDTPPLRPIKSRDTGTEEDQGKAGVMRKEELLDSPKIEVPTTEKSQHSHEQETDDVSPKQAMHLPPPIQMKIESDSQALSTTEMERKRREFMERATRRREEYIQKGRQRAISREPRLVHSPALDRDTPSAQGQGHQPQQQPIQTPQQYNLIRPRQSSQDSDKQETPTATPSQGGKRPASSGRAKRTLDININDNGNIVPPHCESPHRAEPLGQLKHRIPPAGIYIPQPSFDNKALVRVALTRGLLSGPINAPRLSRVLTQLTAAPKGHFIVILKGSTLPTYSALARVEGDGMLARIDSESQSVGDPADPSKIPQAGLAALYKYDSGRGTFVPLLSQHVLSNVVNGCVLDAAFSGEAPAGRRKRWD